MGGEGQAAYQLEEGSRITTHYLSTFAEESRELVGSSQGRDKIVRSKQEHTSK